VLQRDVPIHFEAIGETRGDREIEIRARVEGFVDSADCDEGSLVEKGQLLYSIDPRPFEICRGSGRGERRQGRGAACADASGRRAL